MECPKCKSKNVRARSGIPVLIVGLIMWIGGVFGPRMLDANFLKAFSGIAGGVGFVITLLAVFELLFGKNSCNDCKEKWR